jgi:hypothetical protein
VDLEQDLPVGRGAEQFGMPLLVEAAARLFEEEAFFFGRGLHDEANLTCLRHVTKHKIIDLREEMRTIIHGRADLVPQGREVILRRILDQKCQACWTGIDQ